MSDMKKLIESIDKITIREDENAAAELESIAEQMMMLLDEARQVVKEALRSAGRDSYSDPIAGRMESYWYPSISSSIEGGSGSMFSIMSTIEDLQEMGKGPEDEYNQQLEVAANELSDLLDKNPDASTEELVKRVAFKYGLDIEDLDDYMNQ